MNDDLVKRLRDNCSCNFPDTPCGAEEQCRNDFEAADYIERLEASLVRTFEHMMEDGKRVETLEAGEEDWNRICNSYAARIDKLEAALSDIIVLSDDYSKAVPIARKALEGKDD